MKIIIVGAGIAGLTLGLACQRQGMDVKLYEKASALQNIGGGILLWPHGIRYLEWLGLADYWTPFKVPIKGCYMTDNHGQKIFSQPYSQLYSLIDGEILPIDRSLLQQAMLSQLAGNALQLGKTCVAIENNSSQARVIFADGTQDCADLIVGADGIHSAVRKSFKQETCLQYTHHCWWGGLVESRHVPNLALNEVYMAMGVGKMCIAWPTVNENFMWYLPVKMPLQDFIQEGDGQAQLQTLCAGWNADVQQIIDAPSRVKKFHLPINILPAQTHLSDNRVVLIGDAAHTLGPILGQGASQAIEDVFVLMNCLRNKAGDVSQALKYYETFRHAKYQRMAELENQLAESMIHDDAESLASFQQHAHELNLTDMYQDLIPLIDENACQRLAAAISMESVNS